MSVSTEFSNTKVSCFLPCTNRGNAPYENQAYWHRVCTGKEMDRAYTHIAGQSALIFERKELFFVKYSVNLLFKTCAFEFGFKEFFENGCARACEKPCKLSNYCSRLFFLLPMILKLIEIISVDIVTTSQLL